MLEYYLKFFVEPTTRKDFYTLSGLGNTAHARSVVFRLNQHGLILPLQERLGYWRITKPGLLAHELYLGVKKEPSKPPLRNPRGEHPDDQRPRQGA